MYIYSLGVENYLSMKKRTKKEIEKDILTYEKLVWTFEAQNDYEAVERSKLNLEKCLLELKSLK
jgi:hypothetical protein